MTQRIGENLRRILPAAAVACLLILIFFPLRARAEVKASFRFDPGIYAGGVYDAEASIGEPGGQDYSAQASYQWQVAFNYSGSPGTWGDLEITERTPTVNTSHFRYITRPDTDTGPDAWSNVVFIRCHIRLNGKDYYTEPIRPVVYSYSVFQSIYQQEISTGQSGLGVPAAAGATSVQGSGSNYTAVAEAQKMLTFSVPAEACKAEGSQSSEVRAVPEIWITENGKTTHGGNGKTYTPVTVGNGAVTVEYRMRVYMGDNDCGIYQTKTMVITTTAPAGGEEAVTSRSCSLLRDRYNESQKLITIPQGAAVNAVFDSGQWYKVTYGGYVGFVGSDALTFRKTVRNVALTLRSPQIGEKPDLSPVPADASSYGLYPVDPVEWYDLTAGKTLPANGAFQAGHKYRVSIWVSAKSGSRFATKSASPSDLPDLTVTLNGNIAAVQRAYEQDPKEVVEITGTFGPLSAHTHSMTRVARVEPACLTSGHEAYYRCSGCGKTFSDSAGNVEIDPSTWGILPAKGHTPGPAATESAPQICTVCHTILTPALGHRHSLYEVKAVPATCMEGGTIRHYACTGCSERFLDSAGNRKVTSDGELRTNPLGHVASDDWKYGTETHWRVCTRCAAVLDETKMMHDFDGDVCSTCGYRKGGEVSPEPEKDGKESSSEEANGESGKDGPGSEKESGKGGPDTDAEPGRSGSVPDGGDGPSKDGPSEGKEAQAFPGWVIPAMAVLLAAVLILAAVLVVIIVRRKQRK